MIFKKKRGSGITINFKGEEEEEEREMFHPRFRSTYKIKT